MLTYRGNNQLTNAGVIRLLESKSIAYKGGYARATANGDTASAKKWKKGYQEIKERIYKLRKV
jgi:hypothetical protein